MTYSTIFVNFSTSKFPSATASKQYIRVFARKSSSSVGYIQRITSFYFVFNLLTFLLSGSCPDIFALVYTSRKQAFDNVYNKNIFYMKSGDFVRQQFNILAVSSHVLRR